MRLIFPYILLVPLACGPGTGTTDASTSGDATTGSTAGTTTAGTTTAEPTTGEPVTTSGPATTTSTTTTSEPTTSEPTTTTEPGTTSLETTTGVLPGEVECEQDADCKLNQDCCTCEALPVDERAANCDENCRQPMCAAIGVTGAVCNLGVCEPKRLTCDQSKVACDEATPVCPPGTLPSTTPACWTHQCVPAELCDVVPDCSACPGDMMCVQKVAFGVESSCQPIPPGCDGTPTCECVSDLVCVDGFAFCSVDGPVVSCECPNC